VNRRIVIVTAVATVGLLAAWFFALWQPKGEELSAERERLASAEDAASQLETRILKLKQSQANGPQLLARLDTLRSAVPDSPNLPQFILDANDAAVASGVEFVSISPREPAPSKAAGLPPEIGLGVQIEGGYFQVLDFLERLTDMQRVVVLDGVNVTPMGTGNGPPELSVSLNGRMFTTQLPASATPEAAAGQSTPEASESTTTTTQVPA
jgi:Tfp pilus assembly protein PilO